MQGIYKKIGIVAVTGEHPQTTLTCSKNMKKKSNFAVLEITNNFTVGMQFRVHSLATKKLTTPKAPRNTPKPPYNARKKNKKHSNFGVFDITNNLITIIRVSQQ